MNALLQAFSTIHRNAPTPNGRSSFWRQFASLVICGAGLFGCVASSHLMTDAPVSSAPIGPAAGQASVVFARPSNFGWAVNFTIIDHNGRFVGDAVANCHFAVQLPPGEYFFITEGENTEVIRATLAPGKVYYVEVAAHMGILSARVSLEPVRQGTEAWHAVVGSLAETKRLLPLTPQGQAELDRDAKAIQHRIEGAKQKWADFSPAEQAERTLKAEDGVGDAAPAVAAPQTTPPAVPQAAPAGSPAAPPVPGV